MKRNEVLAMLAALHPTGPKARDWIRQGMILDAVCIVEDALTADVEPVGQMHGENIGQATKPLFEFLQKNYFVSAEAKAVRPYLHATGKALRTVYGTGPEINAKLVPLLRAIMMTMDATLPALELGLAEGGEELWGALRYCLEQCAETYEKDAAESKLKGPSEELISESILLAMPRKPAKIILKAKVAEPSAYIVGGQLYVARGRAELKRFVLETTGRKLTGRDIEGLNLGEVLEDGRTIREVISGATVPGRVAEVG